MAKALPDSTNQKAITLYHASASTEFLIATNTSLLYIKCLRGKINMALKINCLLGCCAV
jgi:hypothetical protein